jgi:hypothetical protein
VLAAEHLLRLAGIDFFRELVERAAEVVEHRLSRLGPLREHGQVLLALAQRFGQGAVLLEPPPALEQLLGGRLVLPEIG